MPPVLYLHGFGSSPRSAKIALLRPLLEPLAIELVTPDLNRPSFARLDFDAMVAHAIEVGRSCDPVAIAGSSLGSLVALAAARSIARPLVLIAPALGIGNRWMSRLGAGDPVTVWNHDLAAEVPIHRRFFEQMNEIDVDDPPPEVAVTVIMGRQDETVPFSIVSETWARWTAAGLAPGSKFIAIEEGDHGLTAHAPVIAREIASACGVS